MKWRAFLVSAVGIIAIMSAVFAVFVVAEGDKAVYIGYGAVLGLFLSPIAGVIGLLVSWPVERWIKANNVDDARAKRVCTIVGGVLAVVFAVGTTLITDLASSGSGLALVVYLVVGVCAAAIGALGGTLVWRRRPNDGAATAPV